MLIKKTWMSYQGLGRKIFRGRAYRNIKTDRELAPINFPPFY